jgi:hypothetical protein
MPAPSGNAWRRFGLPECPQRRFHPVSSSDDSLNSYVWPCMTPWVFCWTPYEFPQVLTRQFMFLSSVSTSSQESEAVYPRVRYLQNASVGINFINDSGQDFVLDTWSPTSRSRFLALWIKHPTSLQSHFHAK